MIRERVGNTRGAREATRRGGGASMFSPRDEHTYNAREQVKEARISFSGKFHERGRTGHQIWKDVAAVGRPRCKVAVLHPHLLHPFLPSFLPSPLAAVPRPW